MYFLLFIPQNTKQVGFLSPPWLHMPMFILSGTHPFALSQRREEPRCSDISHPGLQRGVGDDKFSVNGDPGQHRPLGRMETLPGSPLQIEEGFGEEKNVWDALCVSLNRQKKALLSSLSIF